MRTLNDDTLEQVALFLKSMAEGTRLKILRALHDQELSVTDIVSEIGTSQPNISKHLAILARNGIVLSRKAGGSTYYRVADPTVLSICDTVCRNIADRIRQQRSTLKNIETAL